MYLLDTNTLSELRKRRSGKISAAVEAWAGSVDQADMYLSVITIMEIELGIALLERRDPRQAGMLRLWLHDKVMPAFAGRILSIDTMIAPFAALRAVARSGHQERTRRLDRRDGSRTRPDDRDPQCRRLCRHRCDAARSVDVQRRPLMKRSKLCGSGPFAVAI
jgi:predicted nucleic acid-binding protein